MQLLSFQSWGESMSNDVASTELAFLPQGVRWLFANPPLLNTEDRAQYLSIVQQLVKTFKPTNFFDWFAIRDLADETWEILRLRQANRDIFQDTAERAAWLRRRQWPVSRDSIDTTENNGPKPEVRPTARDFAAAARFWLPDAELVQRILTSIEARRGSVLRTMAFVRHHVATLPDKSSADIVDVECQESPALLSETNSPEPEQPTSPVETTAVEAAAAVERHDEVIPVACNDSPSMVPQAAPGQELPPTSCATDQQQTNDPLAPQQTAGEQP